MRRVLVVEDEDSIRELIALNLRMADYEVLEQALRQPTAYVGCIGSRHKVAATRARLLEAGLTEADVERVHSPIGLDIGGETPEEIAVSIAAEMIQVRARRAAR